MRYLSGAKFHFSIVHGRHETEIYNMVGAAAAGLGPAAGLAAGLAARLAAGLL